MDEKGGARRVVSGGASPNWAALWLYRLCRPLAEKIWGEQSEKQHSALPDWVAEQVIADQACLQSLSTAELEARLKLAVERGRLDQAELISQRLLERAEGS